MIRLLKTLPVTVAAALGIAAAAYAEGAGQVSDGRLEQAFDSTIVSTYPDGREAELWLKRDGSYAAEGRRHDRSSGTWQLKDGGQKLCLRQRRPFPAPFNFCTGVPQGGLDKPWAGKAPTGEATRIRVVKGVYDPALKAKDAGPAGKAEAARTGE